MKTLAIISFGLAAACAPQASYLGAELPRTCHSGDAEGCVGWMAERDLTAGELDTYNDPQLTAYVQNIVQRLAAGSQLTAAPHIVIANHEASYATLGGRIVIGRPTIQRLDSEAELAAVLAHELAHIEGHHSNASLAPARTDDPAWLAARRDAEAVADERAVLLLDRAGYATDALARALDRLLEADDAEHPPRATRIARTLALATHEDKGFDGRSALSHHLEHTVLGRDTRLGTRVGDTWIIAALGIAIPLRTDDVIVSSDDALSLHRGATTLTAYAIGSPWARELSTRLEERTERASELGTVTLGLVPAAAPGEETPIGKVEHALRASLPQPAPGTHIAVLDRGRAALIIEVGGREAPSLALRAATLAELDAAQPARLVLERAPIAGTAAESCQGRLVETAQRQVAAGELLRCADRRIASAVETPRGE